MIIIKTLPFKTLIVRINGCNKIYSYNNFSDFINILKDNYYEDIIYQKEFRS